MARIIYYGSAKEDSPIFSRPLSIGTVHRASDYLKDAPESSQEQVFEGKEKPEQQKSSECES